MGGFFVHTLKQFYFEHVEAEVFEEEF